MKTKPLTLPVDSVKALCAAVNNANDDFRAYAQFHGVDLKGKNLFDITQDKELMSAVLEKSGQDFEDALFTAMLLRAEPEGGGRPQ